MIKYIVVYLLIMNLIGFSAMAVDKSRAREQRWRIPEKVLFLLSLLGGSIGTLFGMYFCHHKTKHWYFVIGMPLILLAQIALVCFVLFTRSS